MLLNNHLFAVLMVAAVPAVAIAQPAKAQVAQAPNSALQAACIDKIKPTLKGAERIRDIGSMAGKLDQDVTFRISANGDEKPRTVACQVQADGSLKIVPR